MIRFGTLEAHGVRVVAMSDRSEGHCGVLGENGQLGRTRLAEGCGLDPFDIVCARQVHDRTIVRVNASDIGKGTRLGTQPYARTDGLITNVPGLPLAIFVADCVPVFLFDPVGRAIGLVHAGREGTLLQIATHAVGMMQHAFGTHPGNLHALIGPSAGPCCYEVSPELANAFRLAGFRTDGRMLDLWQANAQQLSLAGIPEMQIMVSGICTICSTRFFSYRHGDTICRNMALLML